MSGPILKAGSTITFCLIKIESGKAHIRVSIVDFLESGAAQQTTINNRILSIGDTINLVADKLVSSDV